MTFRIALGAFLIVVAALNVWAARSGAALEANPGAAWAVRQFGRVRAQLFYRILAACIGLLGVLTILFAVYGITK